MSQTYELSEVLKQNGKDGKPCWIIYKGGVYDVTKFLEEHPGGPEQILEYGGKDSTKAFNSAGHSKSAIKDMEAYKIGEVAITKLTTAESAPATSTNFNSNEAEKSKTGSFCCC